MARGVNMVILIGNLGKEPELRSFPSGDSIATTSLATSESWTDKQTGEKKEHTEWHNLVFRKKLADVAKQYLRKGSKVYVEGSIRTRKWQDKEGQDRYMTEVIVRDLQMLDTKPPADAASGGEAGAYSRASGRGEDRGQWPTGQPGGATTPAPAHAGSSEPFEDDDIPF